MTEIEVVKKQLENLQSFVTRIMEGVEGTCMTCVPIGIRNQQLQQDIKTLQSTDETMQLRQQVAELRAERDALRRTLARMYMDPNAFATAKGWDCFERETE
jgi:cell division protein FtsB